MPDTQHPCIEIIPLGGGAEIGKTMLVVRCGDDIVVVDCGVQFPNDEYPGVDLIIPDASYLVENQEHVRGFVITHGHEDHIGALPYILRQVNAPVYATRLTMGLIRTKLDEHGLLGSTNLIRYAPGDRVQLGDIVVEPIRVTHSIPDAVSLAIHTPVGVVVHTGDFKIDHTPVDGRLFDAGRFAELGREGVALLITDCTNAEKPGNVPSERIVGQVFNDHFRDAPGRVLVTTFASNIHRVQQVFDAAAKHGRRVALAGRSMERNVAVARDLGYLDYSDATRISVEEAGSMKARQVVILTTGSQGEPLSALTRIACDAHKIKIVEGDTVILSSKPIPGNEDAVWRTVNRLIRLGARVVYDLISPVHVSGHAYQEELKLMFNLVNPLFVAPFHGEPRMMHAYAEMVTAMGMPRDRVVWLENGDRLEMDGTDCRLLQPIEGAGAVLVDGISEGGVSDAIIRDRRHLSSGGTVIVSIALDRATGEVLSGPDFASRGFLQAEDSDGLFEEVGELVLDALEDAADNDDDMDWDSARQLVRETVTRALRKRTGRRPVVVPVIMEI